MVVAILINPHGEVEEISREDEEHYWQIFDKSNSNKTKSIKEKNKCSFGNSRGLELAKNGYFALVYGDTSFENNMNSRYYCQQYLYLPLENLSEERTIDLNILLSSIISSQRRAQIEEPVALTILLGEYVVRTIDLKHSTYTTADIIKIIDNKRKEILERIQR